MVDKIANILNEVLEKIQPQKEDMDLIETALKSFLDRIKVRLNKLKIDAEVFVGGSFAKKTVMKKNDYDVDIFVRFDKKYEDKEISKLLGKAIRGIAKAEIVHGSRDYYKIGVGPSFFLEVIPVRKVKSPKESENITDLSYSHVNYIRKKIKSQKILDDIKLAKAFCHATQTYGAESYISGFSGYSLELLVYKYGGFIKFIREIAKHKKDKIIIDIEKDYKNRSAVMMDLNGSKLLSPIILIDPTYKQRNALAALSDETFQRFKNECKKFLKNPSVEMFEKKKTDLEKIKKSAIENKNEFVLVEATTSKQDGDVAGSKLLKFYRHLGVELEKYFSVKENGFNYNGKKSARYYFVVKNKGEIIKEGPSIKDEKNIRIFQRKNKNTFKKDERMYAKTKIDITVDKFLKNWSKKNKVKVKEMSISEVKIIPN